MILATTVKQYENCLMISWTEDEVISDYWLQMLDDLKEWHTLYRGPKTSYNVTNLAACEVYTFRVKSFDTGWHIFKGSTSGENLYTTRHLLSAMRSQKFAMIRKIVKMRPDLLEVENKKSNTPLIQAIMDNDFKMVNLLLHLGANVNKALMFSGKTPLLVAISYNNFELTKFLVNKGAKLEDVDVNGLGVMQNAVNSGNLGMIMYFVDLGQNVNATDRNKLTPLLRAVILDLDQSIVRYLIENGADQQAKDEKGLDYKMHQKLNKKEVINFVPIPRFILN